jgi:hypothetical protein
MVIGSPGTLKSPSIESALKPLRNLEKRAFEKYESEMENYELTVKAQTLREEHFKKNLKNKSGVILDLEDVKIQLSEFDPPKKPIRERFLTTDFTIEKMSDLLSQNPRGIAAFSDEIMGILNKCNKEGHEADAPFLLQGWNGDGTHTIDRIGRGTIETKSMCLSIFGGTQPDKIYHFLRKAIHGGGNDGLVQRFQALVWPDERKLFEYVDKEPDIDAQDRVDALVKELAYADYSKYGATCKEGLHPYFNFDEKAQLIFIEWLTDLESKLRNNDEHPIIIEHLSKYRSLMPSLALIFHLINLSNSQDKELTKQRGITEEAAISAAEICDYLESHARRVYGMVLSSDVQAAALAKKLQSGNLNTLFTIRDVYKKNWKNLCKIEDAQEACRTLVEYGWLKEEITEATYQQKRKVEYKINPKVKMKKS